MNANSFPDGKRGRPGAGDLSRVAEYSASTLPRGGPGTTSRRFPSGTIITPRPVRQGGSASSGTPPWKPLASPYAGTGTPPADQGLKIRIEPGVVWDGYKLWPPARQNIEISVPANTTDGFFVWLVATISATGTVTALDYDFGTTLPAAIPAPAADGAGTPPTVARDLLFMVTSNATGVDLANAVINRNTPLILMPQITNQTATTVERRMVWLPPRSPDDVPSYG